MALPPSLIRHLIIFIVAASIVSAANTVDAAPRPGQPTPDFNVSTITGQAISYENYRGRVLILDFFATWCQPCRESIPHLVEMNRKYGRQGLHILGLNVDEDSDRVVKAFTDEFKVNYPLALVGNSTMVGFGVRSVPVIFLIDKKGSIAEIYRGYSRETGRSMEQSIKRLLAEK